jgi:hypothetical protein
LKARNCEDASEKTPGFTPVVRCQQLNAAASEELLTKSISRLIAIQRNVSRCGVLDPYDKEAQAKKIEG